MTEPTAAPDRPTVLGLELPLRLPAGATPLEAMVLAKCLDEEGELVLYECKTTGLTRWEALGMVTTAGDSLRRGLLADDD